MPKEIPSSKPSSSNQEVLDGRQKLKGLKAMTTAIPGGKDVGKSSSKENSPTRFRIRQSPTAIKGPTLGPTIQ